jgi:hypothetical protein
LRAAAARQAVADRLAPQVCRGCFYRALEDEVHATITGARLFRPGERVAVAASGGKDSTVLAHMLTTLNARHGRARAAARLGRACGTPGASSAVNGAGGGARACAAVDWHALGEARPAAWAPPYPAAPTTSNPEP